MVKGKKSKVINEQHNINQEIERPYLMILQPQFRGNHFHYGIPISSGKHSQRQ